MEYATRAMGAGLAIAALIGAAFPCAAQVDSDPSGGIDGIPGRDVYALATIDLDVGGGEVVALGAPPQWTPRPTGVQVGNEAHVRSGQRWFFVVDHENDAVLSFDAQGRLVSRSAFKGGAGVQDAAAIGPRRVAVSARFSPVLQIVDPVTGARTPWVDLSSLDAADGNPNPSNLFVHEGRLYVGLQRLDDDEPWISADHGALAVIDIASGAIVDTDPLAPGVQAIELTGPHPRLRMAVESGVLYLTATRPFHLDVTGGIEMVDMAAMRSLGFIVSEFDAAALSSFVITEPRGGFLMFHTDIVPSSHLVPFDIPSGQVYGPETALELFRYFDSIAYDARSDSVLMPSRAGVFHIVDGSDRVFVGDSPVLGAGATIDVAFRRWGP